MYLQSADGIDGAPRPNNGGFRGVKGGGWGLKLDALPINDLKDNNGDLNKTIEAILRYRSYSQV